MHFPQMAQIGPTQIYTENDKAFPTTEIEGMISENLRFKSAVICGKPSEGAQFYPTRFSISRIRMWMILMWISWIRSA
jgi:hypothetical protein